MNKKISVLVIFLFVLGIVNTEYIRPKYSKLKYFEVIIGSISNFVGAFLFSLLFSSIAIKLSVKKRKLIIYLSSILVFIILTIEEFFPFLTATKTFDPFDIIASGIGSFIAIQISIIEFTKKRK